MSHGFSKFSVFFPLFPVFLRRLPQILADFPCILAWVAVGKALIQVLEHHGNEDHTVSRSVGQSVTPKHVFKTSALTQHTHSPHQHTPHAKKKKTKGLKSHKKIPKIDSLNPLACSACSHPLPQQRPTPTESCPDCPGKDGGQRKITLGSPRRWESPLRSPYSEEGENGAPPQVSLPPPKCVAAWNREVLHGVGADGVGVKFPIFAVNCCPCPLGEAERCVKKGEKCVEKGEKCVEKGEKCVKKGENHSNPIYTNPIKNLPIKNTLSQPCRKEPLLGMLSSFPWCSRTGITFSTVAPGQNAGNRRLIFIQCGCWGELCSLYEVASPQPSTG